MFDSPCPVKQRVKFNPARKPSICSLGSCITNRGVFRSMERSLWSSLWHAMRSKEQKRGIHSFGPYVSSLSGSTTVGELADKACKRYQGTRASLHPPAKHTLCMCSVNRRQFMWRKCHYSMSVHWRHHPLLISLAFGACQALYPHLDRWLVCRLNDKTPGQDCSKAMQ